MAFRLRKRLRPVTHPAEHPRLSRPEALRAFARGASAFAFPPLLRALRPLQWTKNAVVFAALAFDHHLFEAGPFARSVRAALVFCCLSSAVYLINDLRDIEADRSHPRKRLRPIAAGQVSARQAWFVAAMLLLIGAGLALTIRPEFAAVGVGYLGLMIAYSYGLKRLVILDVFAIAAGFVLRAAGGAVAIDVPISPWLYVCTMLLALFIGFGKRRHELVSLQGAASLHRTNLESYSVPLLDQMIGVVASATVMAYSFYTFDAATVPRNHAMMLTIPFVLYAIFRYLYLIHHDDRSGSPETLLFADAPLFLCIVSWGIASVLILYLSA